MISHSSHHIRLIGGDTCVSTAVKPHMVFSNVDWLGIHMMGDWSLWEVLTYLVFEGRALS